MPRKQLGHTDGKGGTLIIDRVTPLGRLKRASGTNSPTLFRKLSTMITDLIAHERRDYLAALDRLTMRPLEVYELYRVHGAAKMPSLDAVQGLAAALDTWIKDAECGERHRAAHRTMKRRVTEKAGPDAAVADLPRLLEDVRTRYKTHRKHAAFNRIRASALSFARDTLRRSHPVYGAIIDIRVLKERKQRDNNPQTPDEVAALADRLTTDHDRAAVWGMALTGMGPGEWFGKWQIKADRIHIDGTKRAARVRDVPKVMVSLFCADDKPVKPPRYATVEWPIRQFAEALKLASGGAVQPYDLRRTYATWLENSGVVRTRRRTYLGHATGDVTGLYEAQDVTEYLAADADRLRAYIKTQLAPHAVQEPPQEPII